MSDKEFCKNYHGLNNPCDKGVDFDTVRGLNRWDMPCWDEAVKTCDGAEYPTGEEIAKREAYIAAPINWIIKARAMIVQASNGKRSVSGRIACPKCGTGTLHWSIAYNGHVHANCTTQHCLIWME
jgi:hypothetical protein